MLDSVGPVVHVISHHRGQDFADIQCLLGLLALSSPGLSAPPTWLQSYRQRRRDVLRLAELNISMQGTVGDAECCGIIAVFLKYHVFVRVYCFS